MALFQEIRTVLLVNISDPDGVALFHEMYPGLLQLLSTNSLINLVVVTSIRELAAKMMESKPKVLLFPNDLVYSKRHSQLVKNVILPFITGGGLAIFACQFANFVRADQINEFFLSLGLSWKMMAYNKANYGITPFGKSFLTGIGVQENISCYAVLLGNLQGGSQEEAIYSPESSPGLAMSTFGRIGQGGVAYVGDVMSDPAANRLTAALCLINY